MAEYGLHQFIVGHTEEEPVHMSSPHGGGICIMHQLVPIYDYVRMRSPIKRELLAVVMHPRNLPRLAALKLI
jgi:hypothetical protein